MSHTDATRSGRVHDERVLLSAMLHGATPVSHWLVHQGFAQRLFEWRVPAHRKLAIVITRLNPEPTLSAVLVAADEWDVPIERHVELLQAVVDLSPTWEETIGALDRLVRATAIEQCALITEEVTRLATDGAPGVEAIAKLHGWLAHEQQRLLRWHRASLVQGDRETWCSRMTEFASGHTAVVPSTPPIRRTIVHVGLGASEHALRAFVEIVASEHGAREAQVITSDTDSGILGRLRRVASDSGLKARGLDLHELPKDLLHVVGRFDRPLGRSEGRWYSGVQVVAGERALMHVRALTPVPGVRYLFLDGVIHSEASPEEMDDLSELMAQVNESESLSVLVLAVDTARDGVRHPGRVRRAWRRLADRVDRFVEHGRRRGTPWAREWWPRPDDDALAGPG